MRRRMDEEAVSAAIATVLLFAGVLTIISGMMVTIIPVIEEKHGSIERQAMAGQMLDLVEETVRLSETGVPGEEATIPLHPHRGELDWDFARGGTWYTTTYSPGTSLRFDDLLDLDDVARIRYPSGETSSVCFSDLRASSLAKWNYRLPLTSGKVIATPISTLQQSLWESEVVLANETSSQTFNLRQGETLESNTAGNSWLTSTTPLKVLFLRGNSGATIVSPIGADSVDGKGRSWTVPLPQGGVSLHLQTDVLATVTWAAGSASGDGFSSGSVPSWSTQFNAAQGDVLNLESSSDGRLLMVWGNGTGATVWPDDGGSGIGITHTLPGAGGSIMVENSATTSVAVKIDGLYNTVPAQGMTRINWGGVGKQITSTGPVTVHWLAEQSTGSSRSGSLEVVPAQDSGRASGHSHIFSTPSSTGDEILLIQPAAPETSLTILTDLNVGESPQVIFNDSETSTTRTLSPISTLVRTAVNSSDALKDAPFRIIVQSGDDGLMEVAHDGKERCQPISGWASGWVLLDLPWTDLSLSSDSQARVAWFDGSHPLGLEVSVLGPQGAAPHSTLATGWGIHLPRLNYRFESSVSGMEIGFRGGFVGTNHPEYQPDVLKEPPSREGPGPRLAATIPLTMPNSGDAMGSSEIEMTVRLDLREQLASLQAHEIRRGWDGPYGAAIAADAARELAFSSDWLTFPGQVDLLTDYVGWVQLTHSSPEAIYHASGEQIQFNLQLSQISITTEVTE